MVGRRHGTEAVRIECVGRGSVEEDQMKRPVKITTLFLDIGGVLLTNGWDHHARKRAATNFKLEWAEMEDRHHLTFDTYEEGKLTLEEYLNRVVFYQRATVHSGSVSALHVRAIETLPRDDRFGRSAQGPAWTEDRRGQQRSARTECIPDSKVQAGRVCRFFISSCFVHLRKPDADIFRLALDIAQATASRLSISKTPRCSSRSRKVWGFEAFFTRITSPPCETGLVRIAE